jgi:hypothetical protein
MPGSVACWQTDSTNPWRRSIIDVEVSTMTFPIKPPFPIPGGDDDPIEITIEEDGDIDIDD